MRLVMLRGKCQGTFSRVIRGEDGKPICDENGQPTGERLTFPPGEAVPVPDEYFHLIEDDIGKALVPVSLDEKGRIRVDAKFRDIDEPEEEPDEDEEELDDDTETEDTPPDTTADDTPADDGEDSATPANTDVEDDESEQVDNPADTGPVDDGVALSESSIPDKYHAALMAAGLTTLEKVDAYLDENDDLTKIPKIGKKSSAEIIEALDADADTGEDVPNAEE